MPVEEYLLIARSVTQAQRIQRVLRRAGISAAMARAPMELTGGQGCSYALRIRPEALDNALRTIRGAGLPSVAIFLFAQGQYREVEP